MTYATVDSSLGPIAVEFRNAGWRVIEGPATQLPPAERDLMCERLDRQWSASQVAEASRREHGQEPRQRRLFWIGRLAAYLVVFGAVGLSSGLLGGTA